MKPHEITAMVLGVLGFVLSCINLWRSVQSNKQTQSLAFAQKKAGSNGPDP